MLENPAFALGSFSSANSVQTAILVGGIALLRTR